MIPPRPSRLVVAAVAVVAAAVPAAAAAHPSVWQSTALVNCTAAPNPPTSPADVTCASQARYAFTNHASTYVLRESNGKTTAGAINYQRAPSLLRNAPGFDVLASDAVTGAHPHATCDIPALTNAATVRSWQGTDPFYAYVPFQRTTVGVDDDPADWLPVVQAQTGLDLTAIPDSGLEAACEGLPGATPSSFVPADATQTSFTALAAHTIALEKAPLEASVATLGQQLSSLGGSRDSESARADGAAAQTRDVQAAYDAAVAEVATLRSALRPLRLALPATIPSVAALARDGIALTLSGPANRTVAARLKISAENAKRLRLRSRILASRGVALGPDGAASFVLEPAGTAAAGLGRARGPLEIAVDATSGDRFQMVSARAGG